MRRRLLILAAAGALLNACAVGQSIEYHGVTPAWYMRASGPIVVAVHDRRPEIVKGGKEPSYCGVLRGSFGTPFDVNTEGEVPLAEEFTAAVMRAMGNAGFSVTWIKTDAHQSDQQVSALFSGKRTLLIQIGAWHSDTYNNTALAYDVTASVIDHEGRTIGRANTAGRDELGGSFFSPHAHANEAVPAAYRAKLERLLNHPKIVRALQPATTSPLRPTTPSS